MHLRKTLGLALPAVLALAPLAGCRRIPLSPSKPVPTGTLVLRFGRAVRGPLELSLDGARIPVAQKSKKGEALVIAGLAPGKHHFFLGSPEDAFGPDYGDVILPDDHGVYMVILSQRFNAELYGSQEAMPAAEGLPGVSASLVSSYK